MFKCRIWLPLLLVAATICNTALLRAQQPDSLRPAADSTAALEITSEPAGANVTLDDQLLGTTPFRSLGIRPGSARVTVWLSGYDPWSEQLVFTAGRAQKITLRLNQITAELTVTTNRTTSRVFVDGMESPAGMPFTIPAGTHKVRVADDILHREIEQDIVVKERNAIVMDAKLGYPSVFRLLGGVMLPGVIQIADGSLVKGGAFLVGFAGLTIYMVRSQGNLGDAQDSYNGELALYNAARSEPLALRGRASVNGAYDDLRSATRKRNVALAAAGAVFAANAIDIILHHLITDSITMNSYWGEAGARTSVLGAGADVRLLTLSVPLPVGGK